MDELNRSLNNQNFDWAPDKEDGDDAQLAGFLRQVGALTSGKQGGSTPRLGAGLDIN